MYGPRSRRGRDIGCGASAGEEAGAGQRAGLPPLGAEAHHGATVWSLRCELGAWARRADVLDALVQMTLEPDREVAAVLTKCRESLRAISWNRYADQMSRRSRARVLRRRHQTRHKAVGA